MSRPRAASFSATRGPDAAQRRQRRVAGGAREGVAAIARCAARAADVSFSRAPSPRRPRRARRAAAPTRRSSSAPGYGAAKYSAITALTAAKSPRSVRYMPTRTTCVERAAGRRAHRLEVVERAPRLRLDVAFDQLAGGRIERDLAGQVHGVAAAHGLRIRADRGGARCMVGHGSDLCGAWRALRDEVSESYWRQPASSARDRDDGPDSQLRSAARRARRPAGARAGSRRPGACGRAPRSRSGIAATLVSRSRYSTLSMLESASAIAAATCASTPGRLSTSIRSATW